jgi:hypothetical protein
MTVTWSIDGTVTSTTSYSNLGAASYITYTDASNYGRILLTEDTIDATEDWTVSFSVYPTEQKGYVLLRNASVSTFYITGYDYAQVLYVYYNGTSSKFSTSKTHYQFNQWYHITVICDSTNQQLKLFMNGILLGSESIDSSSFSGLWQNCSIGGYTAASHSIRGYIADFKLDSGILYPSVGYDVSALSATTPNTSTLAMNLFDDLGSSDINDLDRTNITAASGDGIQTLDIAWTHDPNVAWTDTMYYRGTGACLFYTSSSEYGSVYMSSALDPTSDWTMEFMIYCQSTATTGDCILSHPESYDYLSILFTADTNISLRYASTNTTLVDATVTKEMWSPIAITYDSTNTTLSVYFNNNRVYNEVIDPTYLENLFYHLQLGGRSYTNGYAFPGYMCDFRLTSALLFTSQGCNLETKSATVPELSTVALNLDTVVGTSPSALLSTEKVLTTSASDSDTVEALDIGLYQSENVVWTSADGYSGTDSVEVYTNTANIVVGATLDSTTDWTIAMNCRSNASTGGDYMLYAPKNTSYFYLATSATDNVTLRYPNASGSAATQSVFDKVFPTDEWVHFALCHDSTAATLKLFINGVLHINVSVTSSLLYDLFDYLMIGAYTGKTFNGSIADLKISSACLYGGAGLDADSVSTTTPGTSDVILNLSNDPGSTSCAALYDTEKTLTETAVDDVAQSLDIAWAFMYDPVWNTTDYVLGTASITTYTSGTEYGYMLFSSTVDPTGDWTMRFSILPSYNTIVQSIFRNPNNTYLTLGCNSSAAFTLTYPNTSGGTTNFSSASYSFLAGDWVNIALQHDSTNAQIKFFKNGSLITTLDVDSSNLADIFTGMALGAYGWGSTYIFKGSICDFALDSTILYSGNGFDTTSLNVSTPGPSTGAMNLSEDAGTGRNALLTTEKVITTTATDTDYTQEYDVGWSLISGAKMTTDAYYNGESSLQPYTSSSEFGYAMVSFDIDATATDFTIEMWVYAPSSGMSSQGYLIYSPNHTSVLYLKIASYTANLYCGGTNYTGSTTLTSDAWNHIALCYENSTETLTYYLNGVAEITQALTATDLDEFFTELHIGGSTLATSMYSYASYINSVHIASSMLYSADFDTSADVATTPGSTSLAMNMMRSGSNIIALDETVVVITSDSGIVVTVTTSLGNLAAETDVTTTEIYYTIDSGTEQFGGTGSFSVSGLGSGAYYEIRLDDDATAVTSGTLPTLSTSSVAEVTADVTTTTGKVCVTSLSTSLQTLVLSDVGASFGTGASIGVSSKPGTTLTTVITGDSVDLDESVVEKNYVMTLDTTTVTTINITDDLSIEVTIDESDNILVDGVELTNGVTVGGYLVTTSSA